MVIISVMCSTHVCLEEELGDVMSGEKITFSTSIHSPRVLKCNAFRKRIDWIVMSLAACMSSSRHLIKLFD